MLPASLQQMDQSNSQETPRPNLDGLDEDMYVVEKILKKRTIVKHGKQTIMYFVRWEGYPDIEDHTWEPQENLSSVPTLIEEFEQKLEEKKRREREEAKRKEEASKAGNKNLLKHNDPQLRKIQSQNSEVQDKPHKLLKKNNSSAQNQDSYDSYRRKESDAHKDPSVETPKDHKEKTKSTYRVDPIASVKKDDGKESCIKQKVRAEGDLRTALKDRKDYGRVLNHIYQKGQILYEVQILSKDKKVRQIEQITSQVAASECQKSTLQYLQKLIVRMQELNREQ